MSTKSVDRHLHHFERRRNAAIQGRHLPMVEELLQGGDFMNQRPWVDGNNFIERLLPKIPEISAAHAALLQLTVGWSAEDCVAARQALDELAPWPKSLPRDETLMRFSIYAATEGDKSCAAVVGQFAIYLADREKLPSKRIALLATGLGWLVLATTPDEYPGYPSALRLRSPFQYLERIRQAGLSFLESYFEAETELRSVEERKAQENDADVSPRQNDAVDDERTVGICVAQGVGNVETSEGKKVRAEMAPIIGKQLKLMPVPDLVQVRTKLLTEFPHASQVIDRILGDLVGRDHIEFSTTILRGSPGSGKTSLARRLLDYLGVPNAVYSCGGVSDSSLAGTPRRWSTGEPSLPLSLMLRHRIANPAIVLDEIEKVGTGRHNGNLLDALLAFWERTTAESWFDPYLQAPINLSHVLWLATANTTSELSAPLRDRVQILDFPDPTAEHLHALVPGMMEEIARERGMDPRWMPALDGEEWAALERAWTGGSLRLLRRLVAGLVQARESDFVLH